MEARQVRTIEDARQIVEARGLSHVKVGVFDHDGVLRGKYMSRAKFFSSLEKGFGFCDVVLGWDSNDQLYDNTRFTGWHTGYPDATLRIVPESCRESPLENTLLFLGEFEGAAAALCPRALLRRVLSRATRMGFSCLAGFEYEFFVFDETPRSAAAKGFRGLTPFTPGNFGYSMLRSSAHAELYESLLAYCESMDMPLEGLHTETGPGVLEAAIGVDHALSAADKAALFKTFAKVFFQRREKMATFMAKWSNDCAGQSGHLHLSLVDPAGEGVFHEQGAPLSMSTLMRHFVAGQAALLPELLAMVAPTVNAYSRLVPGYWAPTSATWGVENRTVALRVIPGSPKSQRVEFRIAAADANPYLCLAAALAAGLHGIEQKLPLGAPVEGNAYQTTPAAEARLPRDLGEAARRLGASEVARDWFGREFVDHFAAHRDWEVREFQKHITDWELRRYFEII